MISLATIVPAHNEEGTIEEMAERLCKVYSDRKYTGQIIFAANGCTDSTVEKVEEIALGNKGFFIGSNRGSGWLIGHDVSVIGLEYTQGHKSKAIASALHYAQSDLVAVIDADLQYHPEVIPEFVAQVKEKRVVSGKRRSREDPFLRTIIPKVGHVVFNVWYNTSLEDINSGIKVMPRNFFEVIQFERRAQEYFGLHKFLVPMAVWEGWEVKEVDVDHYPRTSGQSHITLFKTPYRIWEDYRKLRKEYNQRTVRVNPSNEEI